MYDKSVADLSLHGVFPAIVTPFRQSAASDEPAEYEERIDCGVWQALIDSLIEAGVQGIFAAGSQGEFFALDMQERQVALRFCRQAVAHRTLLCGNVGCVTTRDTVKLAQAAEAIGVDLISVVTPYYIQPTQDELVEHYVEVCRSVRLPVMAYNFPLHGGVELAPASLGRIAARCENLAGIKDSSGRLPQALAYRDCADRPLAVFVGYDNLMSAAIEQGCAGVVTNSANLAPRLYVDLYRALRKGRRDEAARLQELATELGAINGLHTFPGPMKEAMNMAGIPVGACRKPLGPMEQNAREKLAAVVAKLKAAGYLARTATAVSS